MTSPDRSRWRLIWVFAAITLLGPATATAQAPAHGRAIPTLLGALVVLLGWAKYHRRRFQGADRRGASPALDPTQTAIAMGLPAALAREIRQVRRAVLVLVLGLGEYAMPIDVERYPTAPDSVCASSRRGCANAAQVFPWCHCRLCSHGVHPPAAKFIPLGTDAVTPRQDPQ